LTLSALSVAQAVLVTAAGLGHHDQMKCVAFAAGVLLAVSSPALCDVTDYPAVSGRAAVPELVVYSSLDEPLARPMIRAFQKANPDIAVRYEDMLTGEIHDRIVEETDGGRETADFAFSSAMDLQVKLANDGYAQPSHLPMSARWPAWANWRDTAYALTFEPAVFVYHKPSFAGAPPPATRAEFIDYLRKQGDAVFGRIGTYDIERSGVGFLFMSRDQEQFDDIWSVVKAMGAAGVKLYSTSEAILERVADGRFVLGYNILGSYAADWATNHADVGIVLPKDYTVVMSRIGLVPQAARSPELGRRFLDFFMSKEGQTILTQELQIPAVSPDVAEGNTATTMREMLGGQLKPVPVSPGLMVYLDQVKRARLIARWNDELRLQ
jgi:iron(III) transport system substrate-binding protein